MGRSPVFLERQSYRQRRLMDAIKLLPFLGLVIWMVPLLWPQPQPEVDGIGTATALRYLFGGWILMVCAACLLWRRARHQIAQPPEQQS